VKPRPTIKLPIVEIATKLTSSSGSQKSFLLMYLQMGFERCEENEKLEVAKILIPNLHLFTEDNQYSFLSTILPVIDKLDVEKGESFTNEKVRAIVLKYFFRVMLLSQTGLQNGGYHDSFSI
jgi:hypothetical protein